MTELEEILRRRLAAEGRLTLGAWMEACLYHPAHGYYTKGLNFLTNPARDFITAPELTPIFGTCVANWVRQWMKNACQTHEKDIELQIIEVGPGRGKLLKDIAVQLGANLSHLRAELAHLGAELAHNRRIKMQFGAVERSPTLREVQRATWGCVLRDGPGEKLGMEVQEYPSLRDVPHLPTLVIANEVLDAFPFEQSVWRGGQWWQRGVDAGVEGGWRLTEWEMAAPPPFPHGWQPAEGATVEYSTQQIDWLAELAKVLRERSGRALLLDYGYAQLPPEGGDTVQAMQGHKPVPLWHEPGESDITAHVNFGEVQRILGVEACRLEDLGPWLLRHGLAEAGLKHLDDGPAIQRLVHPAGMGQLFKVLEFRAG